MKNAGDLGSVDGAPTPLPQTIGPDQAKGTTQTEGSDPSSADGQTYMDD